MAIWFLCNTAALHSVVQEALGRGRAPLRGPWPFLLSCVARISRASSSSSSPSSSPSSSSSWLSSSSSSSSSSSPSGVLTRRRRARGRRRRRGEKEGAPNAPQCGGRRETSDRRTIGAKAFFAAAAALRASFPRRSRLARRNRRRRLGRGRGAKDDARGLAIGLHHAVARTETVDPLLLGRGGAHVLIFVLGGRGGGGGGGGGSPSESKREEKSHSVFQFARADERGQFPTVALFPIESQLWRKQEGRQNEEEGARKSVALTVENCKRQIEKNPPAGR